MRERAGQKSGRAGRFATGADHQGPSSLQAGLKSRTINLEWHQFARLGDFSVPFSSLGIMMGKADDWNPPGLGRAGPRGVGMEGARENE